MLNFRKKSRKMWRSLEKQNRGAKQREQSITFRTPQSKVRKFSHHAKHSPGTRVAFRTAQTNFRTMRIKVRKFRTPKSKVRNSFQSAKITVQCANSLHVSFPHHYSRCENFRTVRSASLAHECHHIRYRNGFAQCETRCKIFAQCEIECETRFKVQNSQFKVRKFRTVKFKVRNWHFKARKSRTVKF